VTIRRPLLRPCDTTQISAGSRHSDGLVCAAQYSSELDWRRETS
jgi:hypothetical protein